MNKNSALGGTWEDLERELFTPEEIEETDLRVNLICDLIHARNNQQITQEEFEELIDHKHSNPSETDASFSAVQALEKKLKHFGLKLSIVPIH